MCTPPAFRPRNYVSCDRQRLSGGTNSPPGVGGFTDSGYWVVSRHRDVREVSRRSDVFSSAQNCIVPRYVDEETARGQIEAGRFSMINMDAPQHTRMRKIVSRGFTPRAVDRLRADLTQRARRIVADAAGAGSGDFVAQVASELPLQLMAGLLGVPFEDRSKLFHWTNEMVGDEDPEFAGSKALESAGELMFYGMQLAADKADHPGDDIVTHLITADVDGHKLSDEEFGLFMVTLTVAGNETTRNSITQGMMAFLDNPAQWATFKERRPLTAADEIIRWATPITAFQRTALRDTELGGAPIKQGQRLALFYRSANFDEDVFDDPFSFNVLRDPNPHLSFGGTGVHYCLGGQPRTSHSRADVQCDCRRHARPHLVGHSGAIAVRLAQRDQALAGRLHRQVPGGSLTQPHTA